MRRICIALALFFSSLAIAGVARAQDSVVTLFQKLTDAPGPSGYEEPVAKIMVEEMKPYADKVMFDGMGSVIAQQGSSGPRIMLDAHTDELGGLIRRVTPNGYLSMQMLGGWLDQALVDQRWVIIGSKGPIHAVTGIRDIHVVPKSEETQVYPADSIFLDIGAKTDAEVKAMGVEPGDPVVPDSPFLILNGTQNYLAKAWDDRIGCAVLIELMHRFQKEAHPNQLFYTATVQEEIGLRGAETSAHIVKPDIGIAFEVGITKDVPGIHPEEAQEVLGGGPGFFFYDWSALPNRKLVAFVKQTAADKSIPLQYDLITGYGEDGAVMQKNEGGVPIINMVVPTRYTHAHNGIINRADFDRMVDLVEAMVLKLDANTVAKMKDFTPAP